MNNIKECRSCFEQIDSRSSICSNCGTLQNRFKAFLIYLAGVVGVFSLVASSLSYLYGQFIEAKINKDPLEILSYSHGRGGVFLNKSANSVYIRSILLLGNGSKNLFSENIQTIVEAKGVKKYKNPQELFGLSPHLEDKKRHWNDVWTNNSTCFSLLILTDRAYLDNGLTETVKGTLSYINSSNGRVNEKEFSAKAALLLNDKPECKQFGNPNTIFK